MSCLLLLRATPGAYEDETFGWLQVLILLALWFGGWLIWILRTERARRRKQ